MSELKNFGGLDEASFYFMNSAFDHIKHAFIMERANIIFGEEIMKINVPNDWEVPEFPESIEEQLEFNTQLLPEETIEDMAKCWEYAQAMASESDEIRLPKGHKVNSIEIVGHIINLHAFVETQLNRHLYYLRVTNKISGEIFNSLDRTEFIPKILYMFKDEVDNKELNIQQFRSLNKLRNNAVHFKKGSRESIKPTIGELILIWREVGILLMLTSGEPNGNQILGYMKYLTENFLAMKNRQP